MHTSTPPPSHPLAADDAAKSESDSAATTTSSTIRQSQSRPQPPNARHHFQDVYQYHHSPSTSYPHLILASPVDSAFSDYSSSAYQPTPGSGTVLPLAVSVEPSSCATESPDSEHQEFFPARSTTGSTGESGSGSGSESTSPTTAATTSSSSLPLDYADANTSRSSTGDSEQKPDDPQGEARPLTRLDRLSLSLSLSLATPANSSQVAAASADGRSLLDGPESPLPSPGAPLADFVWTADPALLPPPVKTPPPRPKRLPGDSLFDTSSTIPETRPVLGTPTTTPSSSSPRPESAAAAAVAATEPPSSFTMDDSASMRTIRPTDIRPASASSTLSIAPTPRFSTSAIGAAWSSPHSRHLLLSTSTNAAAPPSPVATPPPPHASTTSHRPLSTCSCSSHSTDPTANASDRPQSAPSSPRLAGSVFPTASTPSLLSLARAPSPALIAIARTQLGRRPSATSSSSRSVSPAAAAVAAAAPQWPSNRALPSVPSTGSFHPDAADAAAFRHDQVLLRRAPSAPFHARRTSTASSSSSCSSNPHKHTQGMWNDDSALRGTAPSPVADSPTLGSATFSHMPPAPPVHRQLPPSAALFNGRGPYATLDAMSPASDLGVYASVSASTSPRRPRALAGGGIGRHVYRSGAAAGGSGSDIGMTPPSSSASNASSSATSVAGSGRVNVAPPPSEMDDDVDGEQRAEWIRKAKVHAAALDELLSTEADYVVDLRLLDELYSTPLEQRADAPADLVVLLHDARRVCEFSVKLLGNLHRAATAPAAANLYAGYVGARYRDSAYMSIRERFAQDEGDAVDSGIGGVAVADEFIRLIPDLQSVYTTYCARSDRGLLAARAFESLGDAFMDQARTYLVSRSSAKNWNLECLLIKPVQRVLKYSLFLNQLAATCAPPARDRYLVALRAMDQVAGAINAACARTAAVLGVGSGGVGSGSVGYASGGGGAGKKERKGGDGKRGKRKSVREVAWPAAATAAEKPHHTLGRVGSGAGAGAGGFASVPEEVGAELEERRPESPRSLSMRLKMLTKKASRALINVAF